MKDFIYYAPTKVYFGKDEHKKVGNIIREYGFKKIMLQYGKGSIKTSGLYDTVMTSLRENGIEVVEMGGVQPNPTVEFVREAIEVARREKVELVLAVGGGSAIDSAKCTAAGALYDGDEWDLHVGKGVPEKTLPTACILTIAAAGSEMSSSAVLTNSALNFKKGFNNDLNRCLFSICSPELTFSVSPYQTACGIVDIMSHTMERYFTLCPPTDITDRISESLLRSVVESGKIVMKDPENYDARANIMWASSLSHNGLTGCGRENALAVHQLEHALSGEFEHIAHGAGLAVLFPAWARNVYGAAVERFAQFARRVWDVTEENDEKAALMGIERMEEFFLSIGMPLKLREFGIEKESIERLSDLCTYGKTRAVKSYLPLDYDRVKAIYESCY